MILPGILFYVFSAIMVLSALGVIASRNPVYSVLFLILAFFNAAGLFLLLGAELLAMLLIIVYVGAVAVLFLFVVMMLNINFVKMKEGFIRYLPVGLVVAAVLFGELFMMLSGAVGTLTLDQQGKAPIAAEVVADQHKLEGAITNTHAIGYVLYTDYAYLFQIAGLILLVAMIGAIVLTHRQREGVKRQVISTQLGRDSRKTVEKVKVKSGAGV